MMFGLLPKMFSEIIPETLVGVIWWNEVVHNGSFASRSLACASMAAPAR
jgi:hypothetical protein